MAAGGAGGRTPTRDVGRTAHGRGAAGPVVVVRPGDRRLRDRVGVAAARGATLMALWERLARVFGHGGGARERSEAERILLEADFGVETTEEILDRVSGGGDGDVDFRAALERAVIGALTPAVPGGDPGALARAPARPSSCKSGRTGWACRALREGAPKIPRRWRSTRSQRRAPAAPTRCSWTRPGDSTRKGGWSRS